MVVKYLETNTNESSKKIKYKALADNTITGVSTKLNHVPGYRPFQNHHLITDKDIVLNDIQCTTAAMANEVHVMTPKPNTDLVRKAWEVATSTLGVNIESNESYWKNQVASFCVFQSPSEKIIRRITEPNAYTTTQGVNIAMRDLAEAMKPMYRGQIILVGRRDIKPYDIIHLKDTYHKVFGALEVAKVTHVHSLKEGWTTTIEPHLVNHYGEVQENYLITGINVALSLMEGALLFSGISSMGRTVFAEAAGTAVGEASLAAIVNNVKTKGINVLWPAATTALNKGFTTWASTRVPGMMKSLANSDYGLSTILTPQFTSYGRGSIAEDAPQTSYLRPVVISPLSKDGQPWVAGLKGTRHYDTSGTFGPIKAFAQSNWEAFGKGLAQYKSDWDHGIESFTEDISRIWRNLDIRGKEVERR
jgi:hypothetical protein